MYSMLAHRNQTPVERDARGCICAVENTVLEEKEAYTCDSGRRFMREGWSTSPPNAYPPPTPGPSPPVQRVSTVVFFFGDGSLSFSSGGGAAFHFFSVTGGAPRCAFSRVDVTVRFSISVPKLVTDDEQCCARQ
jgi:hypothetical protein